ncbi:MAG: hypothetical protein MSG64_14140 [Pyrinomonadaceae bacterium MAG19_C2-C3]|nr:hypothetical protein [Pyrinomonadaceae bacterium MAG19_C2-C3]
MFSEESENSLRDQIGRLIDERLASLKQDFAAMITARTRQAYESGLSDAPPVEPHKTSDAALLKAALDDIDDRRTQSEILDALVNRAASFAPRVVFFVVRNEQAIGWRARGLEGTVGDAAVREINLPLTSGTLLSDAVSTRQTLSSDTENRPVDEQIYSRLGDETPRRTVAVPLVARNRAVAVLYADSGTLDADAVNLEAIEVIVRASGMAVELLATQRPAPTEPRNVPAPAAFSYQPPPSSSASMSQPMMNRAANQLASPAHATSQTSESASDAPPHQHSMQTTPLNEPPRFPAREATPDADRAASSSSPMSQADATDDPATPAAINVEAASPFAETAVQAEPTAPDEPVSYAAPLGSARRFGSAANADLPVAVEDEEEQKLHNDARRFARLLVSEIKLYNEQKVSEGRDANNLYDRLSEEIDRSREMYNKRVAPPVAARYDYFHHELVKTLAEGDQSKLGATYAGDTAPQ